MLRETRPLMDDDFQNPPEEGLKLVQFALKNDYDIVYGDYEIKRIVFLEIL